MTHEILVIEDEPAIADTILYALKSEGFQVSWCATAGEGLSRFRKVPPSLIVLDIGLPDQNGFEVCKAIRKTSRAPIIFLTARSSEVDKVLGFQLGGDDYLPKPFSPRELAARVKAVLRRSAPEPDAHEEVRAPSPFSIDRHRMQITYFGQALGLSRYEFRLLEVLLRHPGWVYSREQLMEMAWEAPESSMDRTVDTHVKTLRAKLRQVTPELDLIQTHRGLGYAIKESW